MNDQFLARTHNERKAVWRMQDRFGRGPFKPGFTKEWKGDGNLDLPPIYLELGISPQQMAGMIPPRMFGGCSVQSVDLLHRWFDRTERRRLAKFGYQVVRFEPTIILAETEIQVLFAHEWPLSMLIDVPARQPDAVALSQLTDW
jgi:hypothetical protein